MIDKNLNVRDRLKMDTHVRIPCNVNKARVIFVKKKKPNGAKHDNVIQ